MRWQTGLNGSTTDTDAPGIEIGQIEPSRSAKTNYGTPPEPAASNTKPVAVYLRTGIASPNEATDDHATVVAGVMIGDNSFGQPYEGVAPKANLHSGAFGSGSNDDFPADADVNLGLTANRIARLSGPGIRVRAINLSATRALQEPVEMLDGTSHVTQFIDWSARAHDVLYAIAWGNESNASKRVPTDNFNGMTIAASEPGDPQNGDNVFRRFGSVNKTSGLPEPIPRTAISLIAPGQDVLVLEPGDNPDVFSGTSAATPHVTGTVALLQQYTSKQMLLPTPNPRFGANSQRHEVMKAVMMNAADKLNGVHGSTRDVLSLNGLNWLSSAAATDETVPLDPWIGAGHLNAKRSVQQYRPGEYDPGTVPTIGWDYQSVGSTQEYVFNQQIGGGYIAATLAWDRRVVKEGSPNQNNYLEGDGFVRQDLEDSLNNLDLYLMPAASNDLSDAIAKSTSPVMSVEHIFFNIPAAGSYKLVVRNNPVGGIGDSQNYALAWWFGNAPPLPKGPGDHDGDGDVDAADHVLWRKSPASFGGDPGGYDEWRANYGNVYSGSGSGTGLASVPEPTVAYLAFVGMLIGGAKRCRVCRTPIASAERLQRGLRTTM